MNYQLSKLKNHLIRNPEFKETLSFDEKVKINEAAKFFELICALETNSETWDDFLPDEKDKICFPYEDVGIDLIRDDLTYLGQCKNYQKTKYIDSKSINRSMLCYLYLLRKNRVSATQVEFLSPPDVKMGNPKLDISEFYSQRFITEEIIQKWIKRAEEFEEIVEEIIELRTCQIEAFDIIQTKYGDNVRIKMSVASGKTDMICYLITQHPEDYFLIMVPQIILVDQWIKMLKRWDIDASGCSCEHSVGTDVNKKVIVCVYNSFTKISHNDFDYIVVDEAHHIENRCFEEEERTYLDIILADERPKIELSATITGEIDYEYTMRQGINDKILVDYQIHIPVYSSLKSKNPLVDYLLDHPEFTNILAYCNSHESAMTTCDLFNENGISASYIISKTSKKERNKILKEFREQKIRVLLSVRILNEGINLVNSATCLFVDMRYSKKDIVQCVGRVLRLAPDKKLAHVILPCSENKADKDITNFLKALADSDEKLKEIFREKKISNRIKIDQINEEPEGDESVEEKLLYEEIYDSTFKALTDGDWMYKYGIFKEFCEINNRFPTQKEKYKGVNIGAWYYNQKASYKIGKLSSEKIALLDEISEEWKIVEEINTSISWDENCAIFKKFHKVYGRLPKKEETYENSNIGAWLYTQKQSYRNGKMSVMRLELLDEIDPTWKIIRNTWEEIYKIFCEFYEENGRFPKKNEMFKEINFGAWFNKQKRDNKNGKMSEERIMLLDQIDETWKIVKKISPWKQKYEIYSEFYEEYNRFPKQNEIYKGFNVGSWFSNQKQNYKNGKMSEEQIILLDIIDESWKNFRETKIDHSISWNEKFDIIIEYRKINGKFPRNLDDYREIYGFHIGSHYCRTRNKDSHKVTGEQLEILRTFEDCPEIFK
jgi:superfamily II DNA or RNA helicase